jgi:hypothetical protein
MLNRIIDYSNPSSEILEQYQLGRMEVLQLSSKAFANSSRIKQLGGKNFVISSSMPGKNTQSFQQLSSKAAERFPNSLGATAFEKLPVEMSAEIAKYIDSARNFRAVALTSKASYRRFYPHLAQKNTTSETEKLTRLIDNQESEIAALLYSKAVKAASEPVV